MTDQLYELNQAEAVFYPAFDSKLCDDSRLTVQGGRMEGLWDCLAVTAGTCFEFSWKGRVALAGYDKLICFLSFPPQAQIEARAVVDGQEKLLFSGIHGGEAPVELTGEDLNPGAGDAMLTALTCSFRSELPHNKVMLSWLGLADTRREALAEAQVPVWNKEWDSWVHKGCSAGAGRNLLFTPQEARALKKKVQEDEVLTEFFRNHAQAAMNICPEKLMREFAPVADYRFVRERDRGRTAPDDKMICLAAAGYLLDEPEYSEAAARLILALLPMKWCEGPICCMAGSDFHHVCFREDHLLSEVCLAMGFLEGILEEEAVHRILDKVEDAWEWVLLKCMEPGYRNYMNQGIVGLRGAMIGASFMQRYRGGYETKIEAIYVEHTQLVNTYLTENGHCVEGPDYYEYSFTTAIMLWHIYAAGKGVDVREVVPERFKRSGRYLEAMMSAGSREGSRIVLNCSHSAEFSTLLVTFMTMAGDFPEGSRYLTARLGGENREKILPADMLMHLYYQDKVKTEPYVAACEAEIAFHEEGLISYRRGGTKLLVSAERNPLTAHFHEDRGGIVLESGGRTILPELGTTTYGNSKHLLMSKKEYHNLACPAQLAMRAASPAGLSAAAEAGHILGRELTAAEMETPQAKVLYAGRTGEGYGFEVETGMLYGEGITGIRRGELCCGSIPAKHSLTITDRWQFAEEEELLVTFLSYDPWMQQDTGTVRTGDRTLSVEGDGEWRFETEERMSDWAGKEVYILGIRSAKKSEHRIISVLRWKNAEISPGNSGAQNAAALQELLDRGGSIRITEPGIYEIEDTLLLKSHTYLGFAPGVILKRAASSVGSFVFMNRGGLSRTYDTDITIEGLHLITNGVEARRNAGVYGLTGELSFFYVKRLRITDFTCLDLPPLSFGLHICTFEDLLIERVRIEGRKDAIHLGTGKRFVIRDGVFKTFDDPIALNAHDYAVANPQMGWIEDGLIENCYDCDDAETTGYFCRILAGSWCDWYPGMLIQNSDTVVNRGRVYRAFQQPDGIMYPSLTEPVHKEGRMTLDGINWVMVQEEVCYNCGCRNIHFRDIHLQKRRETAVSIHFDHDRYSRSVYPGSQMPVQRNLVFENITMDHQIDCLIRSITPVDSVKVVQSSLHTCCMKLESLPETAQAAYPVTHLLLSGNTFAGGPEELTGTGKAQWAAGAAENFCIADCAPGRSCRMVMNGNMTFSERLNAFTKGEVQWTAPE